jgi:purine-binding chemotaxis protein CheW
MKDESTSVTSEGRLDSRGKAGILRSRAGILAKPTDLAEPSQASLEVIVFDLGDEHYAVEAAYIREVFPVTEVTPLPCTPPFIAGVINVRGDIIAIVDLRPLFDLSAAAATVQNETLIVAVGDSMFGIQTDRIIGMTSIPLGEIQNVIPSMTGIRERSLKGVSADQLIILDLRKMVADKTLWVHDEVRQ